MWAVLCTQYSIELFLGIFARLLLKLRGRISKMTAQPWWKNSRGEWYVIIQIFLFGLVLLGPRLFDVRIELPGVLDSIMRVGGLILGAAGALLILVGILQLGSDLTPFPRPKDDMQLVQNGAFGVIRHPLYGGQIIGAVGWSLLTASVMSLVYTLVLFVFFDIKSRREEGWLMEKFPEYAAYQKRVKKLIPFVY